MIDIRRIYSRYRAPLLGVLLLLCFFGYVVYANYFDDLIEEKTIHILPLAIEGNGWRTIETLYIQDLNESSEFDDFDSENSAQLIPDYASAEEEDVSVDPSSPDGSTEPDVAPDEISSSSDANASDSPVPSDPSDTGGANTDPSVSEQEVPDQPAPQPKPESTPAPEPVPDTAPGSEPQISEPSADSGPASFITRVRERMGLVIESVIEGGSEAEAEPAIAAMSVDAADTTDAVQSEPPPEPTVEVTQTPEVESPPDGTEDVAQPAFTEVGGSAPNEPVGQDTSPVGEIEVISASSTGTTTVEKKVAQYIVWNGFALPYLAETETIENAQIRMSFAARSMPSAGDDGVYPLVRIEYSFADEPWSDAGSIVIESESSNALNGGFYLFALPPIIDPDALRTLKIRASYEGAADEIDSVSIDSLWVEIDSMTLNREALLSRVSPESLTDLEKPQYHDLVSPDIDFTSEELPHFALRYHEQRNIAVQLARKIFSSKTATVEHISITHRDVGELPIEPILNETDDGLWSIQIPEDAKDELRPGEYSIELTINEGGVLFTDRFEFQWGLLAINTNETEYTRGEVAQISLGALSPNGNTLCEATLELYLISETNFIRRLPVEQSGLCNGNNVVDVPDYRTSYATVATGTYEMYVERVEPETGRALSHARTIFKVVDAAPVSLERSGPTRIYPVEPYRMTLSVLASTTVRGTLTEIIPFDFEVIETDGRVERTLDEQRIVWDVSVEEGGRADFSYRFDSPDISPFLYELGPAKIVYDVREDQQSFGMAASTTEAVPTDTVEFVEHKTWQIASDATGSMIIYSSDGTTVPSGWTCLSCGSGTFYQRFVRGGATYNTTGGAATMTHTASAIVSQSADANTETRAGVAAAVVSHGHTLTPTITSTSSLPAYRQLRVLQNNSAGEPASIPSGAVLAFDGTLPSGWTAITALNDRYLYGENTTAATGGANTHRHTVSGTTGAASGGTVDDRTNSTAATAAHTHTISSSTPLVSHEPPYITVVYASTTGATTTPVGALTMWTDTPPAGWLNRSAISGDPFFDNFIKGASSYGTTGGVATHTHDTMTGITSSAPSATTVSRTPAGTGAGPTHTHQVEVNAFSTDSNLPPYITAIIARKYGAVPIYTQTSFKWFTNLATSTTPTDPWPEGAVDLVQNEPITATSTVLGYNNEIRLRMGVNVANSTSTADSFKLQFASTTSATACSALSNWADVGSATSSTLWRALDNASLSDGVTLSSSTLTGTERLETYEESNPTAAMPNTIGIGEDGEWDFSLLQNGAEAGVDYCFRMTEDDGTPLFSYTLYPRLTTNYDASLQTLVTPFDNEKVSTTTPFFEFFGTDPESDDHTYQIQIDNDYAFTSTVIDNDSETNDARFSNLTTATDKDPFFNAETIRFQSLTALSNGTTYYWRVRSRDDGSNTYSPWSGIKSFTIDTSLSVSTWHQTTEEQFDTDTLAGVDAEVTDQVSLIVGSTTGTTTSSEIRFEWGELGNAWGSLSWNDTETSGDIKYRLQYEVTDDTWANVPDSALSGNSAGFDTSPISLLSIDPDDYPILRIQAVFSNISGSPSLQDWTLSWGYRIDTPTIRKLFSNEKTATTTPTLEFTTTDPQGDSLIYDVQWSTTYQFTSSTTRSSDLNAGYVNITTATDTSPFFSGNTIQFTLQPADALINGTTYWWRVRARDSGTPSEYTNPQSFTVDTAVTLSTWFQTTTSQFETDILSGATSTGNLATVATSAVESLIVYAEGNTQAPKYREWDGSAWGTEASALTVGSTINWVVTRAGETREEYITATIGTDQDVNVQVFKNGAWGNLQELTTAISDASYRGVDVAYENVSGDAIVVTCDSDADPSYWIWNGSSWTNGGTINLGSASNCGWVKLISDPTSDEIILVSRDVGGTIYEAQVWSGSAWGNSTTMGSMAELSHEGIAAVYEESGNQAVVAVSNGANNNFIWQSWNGAIWSGTATLALGDDFENGSFANDVGSDNMALCYIDNDADIGVVRWTGAAFVATVELETAWVATDNSDDDRPVDCAFEVGGARDGYITVVYSDLTNIRYRTWDGASWAVEASVSTLQDGRRVSVRRTGNNLLQVVAFDSTNDRYDYSFWNGTTWSTLQTLETDGSVGAIPYKEPFMIAARNPGITGSVVGSPLIDWNDGSGPYWQQLSWTDTETGGSTILYQIEYYDGDSWELVPNLLIPGNSSGTTTSPINLTNTLPVASTYNMIRPVANMTCNLGTCPTLADWTLTWAAGITVSGTAQAYNQSTNLTSGTVAVALNGTLQTGKTASISGGTWSIANVNAAPGDVVTVFIDGAADSGEASAVTLYDGVGDVAGMNLYERHLSIGSDDRATVTNANLALYDNTNDEDIFHDVTAGALLVCASGESACQDAELIIKSANTFQPATAAAVTTHDIEINGTFLPNGNTIRVSGSWDNNGTTTAATSTIVMTATTTTETVDQTGSVVGTFNNLTFGETSGTATWSLVTALDVDGNLAVNFGTLARGAQAITVAGNLSNGANGLWTGVGTTTFDGSTSATWTDAATSKQDIGHAVVDGTTKTITLASNTRARSMTIGANDTLDAGTPTSYDITILNNWVNNNVFTARSGKIIFAATTTARTIDTGVSSFYDLTFNGAGGAWSFIRTSLSVTNDLSIATGTVTLPTATTTIAGSFLNTGGTFAHNNGEVRFTSTGAETITLLGTAFTNTLYDLVFSGTGGTWNMTDTNATSSNDITVTAGTVTLPSGTLAVGGSFLTSGTFAHNSGIVRFYSSGSEIVSANTSSFNTLQFDGSGAFTLSNANLTLLDDLLITQGTVTLPTGTLTIGGSLSNSGTISNSSGTATFNSTDGGETISLGASSLYNTTFQGVTGGWTLSSNATSTNNLTITSGTLTVGSRLAVGGIFTNSLGGASTTWTGSTLALYGGSTYQINASTTAGDTYATLSVASSTKISMWNSSASSYTVDSTGHLYSQDHAAVDGHLYIFGSYVRTSGTEYWSAARDFDGTTLASARQVDVRFASGSSATLTGATLSAVGTSSGTTTIASISGTYTVALSGSTAAMQYYSFENLGLSGVTLGTSTIVSSLANGRFVPGINGGTGLTVASSTIDANPALQIYSVEFSTTTAITASNVTQTGVTPASYWWFRSSTGNLDGEAFDIDSGDPGSIRWDDSSYIITVSGTVYSDAGVTPMGAPTCDGVTAVVSIVVAGGSTFNGTCSAANGTYSISNVAFIGDPVLTVFLNTNGGQRATTVTKTPTANITGLDLYANRVITRHESTAALSIADMATYDEDNDTDVRYVAATGSPNTLIIRPETELFVFASTTFTPGGNVTLTPGGSGATYDATFHVDNNATATAQGTELYSVGGRFQVDTGAVFIPASSTVTMTATTTGKTISSPGTIDFNALTFSGGGAWDMVANIRAAADITISAGTVTGAGDIALTSGSFTGAGSLALTGGTTTVARTNALGSTTPWQFFNLTLGDGSVAGTTTRASSATTTVLDRLTISTAHTLSAGTSRWDLRGSSTPFVVSGTFTEGTSFVRYAGSGATTITSDTYYDLDLNAQSGTPTYSTGAVGINVLGSLSVGGIAPTVVNFDTADPVVSVSGDVRIRPNGTLVASAASSFTVIGSWDNDGTFTGSGGTVTFTGTGSVGIAAGASSFSNMTLNGTGAFIISENATTSAALTLTQVGSFTAANGTRVAVGGEFSNDVAGALTTWTGTTLHLYSGTNYELNAKTTADAYGTLSIAANTDIRTWGSSATSHSVDATGSLYSMDHAGLDGELYIYGEYGRTSGTDYWAYAYDFDGVALGGSSRVATVRFASGASGYYSGGGLFAFGAEGATTTVTNQGSGTYSLTVGGTASTTMRYYAYRNLAAAGVTFTGTPTVVSLSNGDIEVVTSGGSGITVGGAAINQNPAKTFSENRFATTTAISAFNVTATGTANSSWRFTNHNGNLSGESYDVDPGGDPGYVVWDNSSANITISGNVYSDEGSTVSGACNGVTQNIKLVVAGVTTYTATCSIATGAYSISGVSYSGNDTLTVFIDGETQKGAVVAVDPVSSIANMHIYENRVIVRHENSSPITIADMAVYDSVNDADIPFTAVDAVTDTLTLPANRKLIIWASKEFAPGGNVTVSGGGAGAAFDGTLELFANSTFTAVGTESHSVGGSVVLGTSALFTAAQSTLTLTTTGAARTIDVNSNTLYNLTFNGSGSWSVTDSAMTIGNNLTITLGAVTLTSGTTTVAGSFTNTGGTFAHNSGTIALSATASGKTLRAGGSSFNHVIFTGVGGGWSMTDTNATATVSFLVNQGAVTLPSGTLAVGSRFFVTSGTVAHNSGTLRLTATTSELLRTNGSDLNNLTFAPTSSYTMSDASLSVNGNLTISSGSVTFATGTLAVGGSLTATGGTFSHASGTVLFNSSDAGETVSPGSSPFYNVSFANASGGWTVASATSTNNYAITSGASYRQASSSVLAVGGVYTNAVGGTATNWDGSQLMLISQSLYSLNTKTTGGDRYNILTVGSSTDISMWNSSATTTSVNSTGSLYSMDHGAADGELYIYGDYQKTSGTDYWSYATDFDGTALGGSPRTVTVRHASNATTTLSGGALSIVGGSGATTTITNQGSGTFSVRSLAGTFSAQNYAFRNLGIAGLELLGTTTVSSLSSGDFELAVSSGALITVSSTTVNTNAGATHTNIRFATTTAITGTNVELTGTTPTSWTFSGHSGNLDGEAYDVESPDDGCGSLRWTNSSCLLLQQVHYRWRSDNGGEGAPNSEWYDLSWTKRARVAMKNNDATTYTNAVIEVTIPYDSNMQSDFSDLRFTDADGTTLLSHWREVYTASTQATVWVEVPSLAASGDTSVFMYYGNALASDTSSGTSTFIAFDDFEDDDIDEYSGDVSLFNVGATYVYERTYGLDTVGNVNSQTTDGIYRHDLAVSQGETFRYWQYVNAATGGSDESCTIFGVQSPGSDSNYAVCLVLVGTDRITIAKNVDSDPDSGTILATTTVSLSTGWHEIEVDWGTDDRIAVTLVRNGSVVATSSVTDSDYTTGGFGFTYWFQHGGWDSVSSRPLLTTEPTIRLGAEQVSGGASWLSALDTLTTSISASTTARLRFVIENTGLAVTNKDLQLEFAEKGASPSCEAVSYGDYVEVPLSASCGSSPLCMTTSSNFTNRASTTDQLGGTGTFTFGQIVEDPSNQTAPLNLAQDYFTEVEYSIVATVNATDGAYCLRVTDAGTDLDSYERVAEMQVRYDPTVTNITLNGGADITLTPGATTTVSATATVTDLNGYADIVSATGTIYRSSVGGAASCSANNNDCYRIGSCTLGSGSGFTYQVTCSADIYYFADPTDIGTYAADEWRVFISAVDAAGSYGSATGSLYEELLTLRALDVSQTIDYGSLETQTNTGAYNATTTIDNIGNDSIDISVAGTNLTSGGSVIPVANQKFATSTFTYSTCTTCSLLATSTTNLEVDLIKPTTPAPVEDEVFWGIAIPFGVAATAHQGVNTFYAIGD